METLNQDKRWMQRCLELASKGKNGVKLNPMVGSVVVYNNTIIGEGYHHKYGEAHAEVVAINAVKDKSLLPKSTIYVNLEPCAHFGKTPPCSDLIVENKLKRVVIATVDPYSEVSGKGIEKIEKAGIETTVGVLQSEARFLNRKFFVFHKKKRPFIILKWAESLDGFIDINRTNNQMGSYPISQPESGYYNHQWRSDEHAILIGFNTAKVDNPNLTTRKIYGENPLRIILDPKNELNSDQHIFSDESQTLVFNQVESKVAGKTEYIKIDFKDDLLDLINRELYNRNIQSLIVEGGSKTHKTFLDKNLWDELRIIKSDKLLQNGLKAQKSDTFVERYKFSYLKDRISSYLNPDLKL